MKRHIVAALLLGAIIAAAASRPMKAGKEGTKHNTKTIRGVESPGKQSSSSTTNSVEGKEASEKVNYGPDHYYYWDSNNRQLLADQAIDARGGMGNGGRGGGGNFGPSSYMFWDQKQARHLLNVEDQEAAQKANYGPDHYYYWDSNNRQLLADQAIDARGGMGNGGRGGGGNFGPSSYMFWDQKQARHLLNVEDQEAAQKANYGPDHYYYWDSNNRQLLAEQSPDAALVGRRGDGEDTGPDSWMYQDSKQARHLLNVEDQEAAQKVNYGPDHYYYWDSNNRQLLADQAIDARGGMGNGGRGGGGNFGPSSYMFWDQKQARHLLADQAIDARGGMGNGGRGGGGNFGPSSYMFWDQKQARHLLNVEDQEAAQKANYGPDHYYYWDSNNRQLLADQAIDARGGMGNGGRGGGGNFGPSSYMFWDQKQARHLLNVEGKEASQSSNGDSGSAGWMYWQKPSRQVLSASSNKPIAINPGPNSLKESSTSTKNLGGGYADETGLHPPSTTGNATTSSMKGDASAAAAVEPTQQTIAPNTAATTAAAAAQDAQDASTKSATQSSVANVPEAGTPSAVLAAQADVQGTKPEAAAPKALRERSGGRPGGSSRGNGNYGAVRYANSFLS